MNHQKKKYTPNKYCMATLTATRNLLGGNSLGLDYCPIYQSYFQPAKTLLHNMSDLLDLIDSYMEQLDAPIESLIKVTRTASFTIKPLDFNDKKENLKELYMTQRLEKQDVEKKVLYKTENVQIEPVSEFKTTVSVPSIGSTPVVPYFQFDTDTQRWFNETRTMDSRYNATISDSNIFDSPIMRTSTKSSISDTTESHSKFKFWLNSRDKVVTIIKHTKLNSFPNEKDVCDSTKRHRFRRWKNKQNI